MHAVCYAGPNEVAPGKGKPAAKRAKKDTAPAKGPAAARPSGQQQQGTVEADGAAAADMDVDQVAAVAAQAKSFEPQTATAADQHPPAVTTQLVKRKRSEPRLDPNTGEEIYGEEVEEVVTLPIGGNGAAAPDKEGVAPTHGKPGAGAGHAAAAGKQSGGAAVAKADKASGGAGRGSGKAGGKAASGKAAAASKGQKNITSFFGKK